MLKHKGGLIAMVILQECSMNNIMTLIIARQITIIPYAEYMYITARTRRMK